MNGGVKYESLFPLFETPIKRFSVKTGKKYYCWVKCDKRGNTNFRCLKLELRGGHDSNVIEIYSEFQWQTSVYSSLLLFYFLYGFFLFFLFF